MVSYSGISNRAKVAALQSDLSNASTQIKLFQVTSPTGDYPTANTCPTPGSTEICLKASNGNTYTYTPSNGTNSKTFTLKATNGATVYRITDDSSPVLFVSLSVSDPANWLAIGTQVWAKANLNVGTMVTDVTEQTNNSILEKYCYDNLESNCTIYGGLYQLDEAMQYVTTSGAQGICPADSHIPTFNEFYTLITYLGGWAIAGTQLKPGGTSGLNMPLAGYRGSSGAFWDSLLNYAILWSSSLSGIGAGGIQLSSGAGASGSGSTWGRSGGYSVRCLGN